MKIFAWVALGLIGVIFLALIYYLLIGEILFSIFFKKKSLHSRAVRKRTDEDLKKHKIDLCWWNDQNFERVEIKSEDQLKLVGFYQNAYSNKTVIVVHGIGSNHLEMQPICKFFSQKNFNILAVDCRAHGESEGKCVGMGWLDRKDILLWIDFLAKRNPQHKILLYGISMGGSGVCCVAGEKLLQNVVAVISDCAFANLDKQIDHVMRNNKLILKLFKRHLYDYVKRIYEFDMKQMDVIKQVKQTKVPMLYLHGGADDFVPLKNMFELYDNTPSDLREKYIIENAEHAMSYAVGGVMYEKKISDFIKSRTIL